MAYNLVSFAGIFVLMAFAWLLSANRRVVNWRVVLWGAALQLLFALFIFVVPAVVTSKLLLPETETETPETLGVEVTPHYQRASSAFEAIIRGANEGLRMVAGIVALLLAFLGLVALLDSLLAGAGERIGALAGLRIDWSLSGLLGYLFYPFAVLIGVPLPDVPAVARLIGERAVLTEVKAYQDLAALLGSGGIRNPRSAVLAAYALCGFAHVASLAVFVGGTAALAPGRTRDLSRVGVRALVAATLACLMTAAVAGTFYRGDSILFGR